MLRLVFDLDGTLVDVSQRHYDVYAECLGECGEAPLDFAEYWERRRGGEGTIQIAAASPAVNAERFGATWLARIEEIERLREDPLYPGVIELLERVGERYELVLATLRRDREALLAQLGWLGIDRYFGNVLSPSGEVHSGSKLAMIQTLGSNGGTCVIGDSEADVVLAQGLKAELVCVTNGVRDESFLRAAGASVLVAGVALVEGVLAGQAERAAAASAAKARK